MGTVRATVLAVVLAGSVAACGNDSGPMTPPGERPSLDGGTLTLGSGNRDGAADSTTEAGSGPESTTPAGGILTLGSGN